MCLTRDFEIETSPVNGEHNHSTIYSSNVRIPHLWCNGYRAHPVSSEVDREFEPWFGQTNNYKIAICCFFAKYAVLRSKSNEWFYSESE
jgi:hypothetical protein